MKRFWVILLSLGLIAIFSAAALAVDVKFSGEFYAAGMYLDKTTVKKDTTSDGPSTAFYYQRLRLRTDFVVTPGLTLVTRMDMMQRAWGASRSAPGTTIDADSSATPAENENIAIDWAYINYQSQIGIFDVGIMNDGATGTIFGNSYAPAGRIKYSLPIGPFSINAAYTKVKEGSTTAKNASNVTDADNDKYGLEGVYRWKGGMAGAQLNYYRYAETRPAANTKRKYFILTPYATTKIGPVTLQAEVNYAWGNYTEYDIAGLGMDVKLENVSGWLDAIADFGKAYVGGTFAYVSGDDPGSADKREGGTLNGGRDWQPCLIMWNYERTYWAGALPGFTNGSTTAAQDTSMSNAWFFQGRAGVRPIDKLDIMASVSYASADKKPTSAWLYNDYGYEVDLTATYKITNNLSYMLGGAYLFTGKYYKGANDLNNIGNDYMIINKLTLTF
jgi:hypothetical protein